MQKCRVSSSKSGYLHYYEERKGEGVTTGTRYMASYLASALSALMSQQSSIQLSFAVKKTQQTAAWQTGVLLAVIVTETYKIYVCVCVCVCENHG